MAVEVQMPKLGATMEKGIIVGWLKNEGDPVKIGEPILEIMTDKINIEVEATNEGVLLKKLYEADAEVEVLVPIAYIGEPGEVIDKMEEERLENDLTSPDENKELDHQMNNGLASRSFLVETKIRRTPAAVKLAKTHGINLSQIKGSGPNQRIQLKDVEVFIKNSSISISPLAKKITHRQQIDRSTIETTNSKIRREDVVKAIPQKHISTINYNGIRKVVGERMLKSANTAPHVTLNTEVDMTKVIEIRNLLIDKIVKKTGFKLSFTEMIVKSTAHVLRSHPMLNSSLNGNQIDLHTDINIGLAVAIPNGLIVPVIRNADQKGLAELTEESKKLANNARDNRLTADELSGGTFTISNLGMYAVDSFTPIINQPEAAILGVGRIRDQVVSINGAIVVRPIMSLSLSFDHRIVDGAPAAHFLTDLKEILENPFELMV
ncbi:dihydrolipoamide acetyltransferase family protein [Bacillus salipaludis]|uniref:dihydrolipoamide acetyltransferase family protein n=1 Tax=Bacillus salipaludis TaxID=2547811 RepID=UPI002E1B4630|nr:dihydrolipoamide acetyltransferase family protein [Bacillus salipaludis]